MFVDDLFNKKTLTENNGGGSPWHSEPEQQQMDANRRGGLERERNAGLDEPDDAPSDSAPTGNGVYEYTVPAGQEDIAQELGLQQHRGHWVSRVPIQRANFQFGRPQFHEIPTQGVAEGLGKDIKRGMAGWGAFDKDKPADVVKRVKGQDTDTLKTLSRTGPTGKGSPAELQQKAISRELKKRGEQGVAEDDAGDVEQRMIAKIEKEKQRLAKLKQTDPEAYKREMEKRKTSSRIPPVSTFEGQGVAEGSEQRWRVTVGNKSGTLSHTKVFTGTKEQAIKQAVRRFATTRDPVVRAELADQGTNEGMLDNPGEQDSPVASAIIRRILLQRTDLLSKYGPEKVGQAVDEVADFVGDVDEIGSSDVSGWIRHVEQMLGNMGEDVAEGKQVSEVFNIVPNLAQQIEKKEDELKALKAKMAARTATNAGIQTGATALIDPDTNQPYEKDKLASMYGYKEPEAAADDTQADAAQTPAQIRANKQKAAAAAAQAQMAAPGQKLPAPSIAPTTTTNPAGFNAGNVMKLPGMEKYAKPAAPAKTANFAGPGGYSKTTTSIKPPAAPSSPALAIPKAPTAPRVTSGGPTPAEKAALDKRIAAAAAAPAVAETIAQVERMLESVNSKKSAEMVKAYVDQKFTELGLRNTTECRNLMTHVVQESAIRRRQHAKSLAK